MATIEASAGNSLNFKDVSKIVQDKQVKEQIKIKVWLPQARQDVTERILDVNGKIYKLARDTNLTNVLVDSLRDLKIICTDERAVPTVYKRTFQKFEGIKANTINIRRFVE